LGGCVRVSGVGEWGGVNVGAQFVCVCVFFNFFFFFF
jgi:hypothetical protein